MRPATAISSLNLNMSEFKNELSLAAGQNAVVNKVNRKEKVINAETFGQLKSELSQLAYRLKKETLVDLQSKYIVLSSED